MTKPKRNRRAKKPPLPALFKEMGEKAIERHMKRSAPPLISVKQEQGGWWVRNPYSDEDDDYWVALLFQNFGTRSQATFRTFIIQLSELCTLEYDHDAQGWQPNEDEMIAAIQIVGSIKPRNEAEAALAAQMVAVHFATMRLGKQVGGMSYPDARTVSVLARSARTYGELLETMHRIKGKRRSTRQSITVRHEKHIHTHQHVHFERGAPDFGGQPHAPKGVHGVQKLTSPERTALPGPHESGSTVPLPSGEGEEGLPHARGRKGRRRPKRES